LESEQVTNILEDETAVAKWLSFFEERYKSNIETLALNYPEKRSLYIDWWDLDKYNTELAAEVIQKPAFHLHNARIAMKDIDTIKGIIHPHIRFSNLPEHAQHLVRELRSKHTNKIVSFEGLVKKVTNVRPRVFIASWQCQKCGNVIKTAVDYFDYLEAPAECYEDQGGCGRVSSFKLIEALSKNIDSQKMQLQENPESIKGGEQPQSIAIYFEDDIVAKANPGDRVKVSGILKTVRKRRQNNLSTVAEFIVEAISIDVQESAYQDIEITDEDEQKILEISKKESLTDEFVASIAPSIFALSTVKKALFLQLFSGVTKHTSDGLRIRGDIHILLAGDPGVAKTKLKDYMYNMAPRGIRATGGGSTKAGLTATAVKDDFSDGQWVLEAGALVLADNGLACIDEFDKMTDDDRGAMHDAMESQEISIAKAGINATLKSRCSVLAICNPKLGRFDETQHYIQQLNMKPSLLSRFDLIFPILDKPDSEKDVNISLHMLRTHQDPQGSHIKPSFTPEFIQKYVAYAKRNVEPHLTTESIEKIQDFYVGLRGQSLDSVTCTPRQLEAMVRLSEAAARSRLSETVELQDVELALEVFQEYLRMIGLDRETNHFDIDIIETGQSRTQHERVKRLLTIVKDISSSNGGSAPLMDILTEAEISGISESKVVGTIKRLKRDGEIYETKKEHYRLTSS
jgi:replicative DNA helicase Mcm